MKSVEEKRLAANLASKAYRLRNPTVNADWYKRNAQKQIAYSVAYKKKRSQVDALYKLRNDLSALVGASFKYGGWSKTTTSQQLLGCSFDEFVVHLQSKFKEGMTLENHGDWHIDHIKPCATATNAEELAALFHFTNLQPLWASENLSKGSTYHG